MELSTVKFYLFLFSIIVIFQLSVAPIPDPFPILGEETTNEINIARDKSVNHEVYDKYDKTVNISLDGGIDIFANITIMNYMTEELDKTKQYYDCARFERLLANVRRGFKVLEKYLEPYPEKKKILVIGGYGDLGFYAFYMARILIEKGYEVTVASFPSTKGRREKHRVCHMMYNVLTATQLPPMDRFTLLEVPDNPVDNSVYDNIKKAAKSVDIILEAHSDGEKKKDQRSEEDVQFTTDLLNDVKETIDTIIISLNGPLSDKVNLCIFFDSLPLPKYYNANLFVVLKLILVVDEGLYNCLDGVGADAYKKWRVSEQGNIFVPKEVLFENPDATNGIFHCKYNFGI